MGLLNIIHRMHKRQKLSIREIGRLTGVSTMIQAGKPPKVALKALMRKMIELANALVQQGHKWTPKTA